MLDTQPPYSARFVDENGMLTKEWQDYIRASHRNQTVNPLAGFFVENNDLMWKDASGTPHTVVDVP